MAKIKTIYRLKADSLLEVIIAAVLIVIIFGIAMMVYSNILRTSRPVKQVRAAAFLRKAALQIERQQDTAVIDTSYEGIFISQSVLPAEVSGTAYLKLTAVGSRHDTLATLNKIILWHEN